MIRVQVVGSLERSRQAVAFGETLVALRSKRSLSAAGLSKRTKFSRGMISQIENGKRLPSLATIVVLAQALQTEPWNLVRNFERRMNETQPLPTINSEAPIRPGIGA